MAVYTGEAELVLAVEYLGGLDVDLFA